MFKRLFLCLLTGMLILLPCKMANAQEALIQNGVYAGEINLSGKSEAQATDAVQAYVDGLKAQSYTFLINDYKETLTGNDLGLYWKNPEIISEAVALGKSGNLVARFKALKDLDTSHKEYDIEIGFDEQAAKSHLAAFKEKYDQKAENATITRTSSGTFEMEGGNTGISLNLEESMNELKVFVDSLSEENAATELALDVEIEAPKGNPEDLARIRDVLGTFSTSYKSSSKDRAANVANGCRLIDGHTLFPGETLSVLDCITPFTEANGYYLAGSYLNGQVVESLGGGICQVSTTLYNAVLLSELEVIERHNHSMIVSYVKPSMDAAIAESSGKDFKFRNNTNIPIYIEGKTYDRTITFTIYGEETRDFLHRKIAYESETLETISPGKPVLTATGSPIGSFSSQSAHTGYRAKLWKIVTEDGVTTRTEVNSSSYKATPQQVAVGTASSDPTATAMMREAIATGDLDHVKGVAAMLKANANAAADAAAQAAAAQALADPAAAQALAEAAAQAAAAQAAAEAAAAQAAAQGAAPTE